jgi:hypothetical protein
MTVALHKDYGWLQKVTENENFFFGVSRGGRYRAVVVVTCSGLAVKFVKRSLQYHQWMHSDKYYYEVKIQKKFYRRHLVCFT